MQSQIKYFYSGKSIFITGATGFVGKVLLLKLLLSCPNIVAIYILIRSKNDQSAEKRLKSMLSSPPFKFVCDRDLDVLDLTKVRAIDGDITVPGFGLSNDDRQLLIDTVSVVFHCAASIKFDAPLKESLQQNVLGTKSVLQLCREMKTLSSFVHVSTAYSNCQLQEIDEKLYPITTDADGILRLSEWVSPASLNAITPHLLEGRPNTYTFTKALAEQIVSEENADFPIAIARPSIVLNAHSEPVPGWVDNLNGTCGISVLGSLGILRCLNWNYYAIGDFVPVDKVANALIAIGWGITEKQKALKYPHIYNIVSSDVNPTTWGNLFDYGFEAAMDAPSIRAVRPIIRPTKQRGPHPIFYPLTKLISHWLFAYVLDFIIMICGHKKIMVRITRKMHYALDVVGYFSQKEWIFRSNNLVTLLNTLNDCDRREFDFNMETINWKQMAYHCYYGNRRYMLKESDDTIPIAQKRMKKIIVAYWLFKMIILITLAYFIMTLTPFNYILSIIGKYFCYLVTLGCPNVPYCPSLHQ